MTALEALHLKLKIMKQQHLLMPTVAEKISLYHIHTMLTVRKPSQAIRSTIRCSTNYHILFFLLYILNWVIHFTYHDDRSHLPPIEYNTLLVEGFSFLLIAFSVCKADCSCRRVFCISAL